MTNAITTDSITERGTATSIGRKSTNSGTAINDSPKPKVDRTKEAIKLIIRIKRIVKTVVIFGFSEWSKLKQHHLPVQLKRDPFYGEITKKSSHLDRTISFS